MTFIGREFANHRGLIRTALSDLMWRLGPYRKYGRVEWEKVHRLVFICQGNICRSPFAHRLSLLKDSGLPLASFGLATETGISADSMATAVAGDFGVDMSEHRATDLGDFAIRDGDLLIVMEDRHIRKLQGQFGENGSQICLLGLWCRPRFALLYDPHRQSREYFSACFSRIDRAVNNLLSDYYESRNGSTLSAQDP